jgi:MFS family permease
LFFQPAAEFIGLLLSFASVGISFLFRPLCAFLARHYGEKMGRAILVLTLVLMGAATTLIGIPPTYSAAVFSPWSCCCYCGSCKASQLAVNGRCRPDGS